MPHRYVYPGTNILKNRFGIRDLSVVNELEAAAATDGRRKSIPGFTADMAGLKATHRTLFEKVYEWAGYTRGETVTIDGETFKPEDHVLLKGDTRFAPASLSEHALPEQLAKARQTLDELQKRGSLTKEKWAELTADQVGAINHVHPFREGNGRTMRRFIELSAEQYGFRARIIGGEEWVEVSHLAMDFRQTSALQSFIERETTEAGAARAKGEAAGAARESAAADVYPVTRDTGTTASLQASTVTEAAAKAVAQIKDPKRRAEAQNLLDNMRKSEANLRKAERQGKEQDRPASKRGAAEQPPAPRDRDESYER